MNPAVSNIVIMLVLMQVAKKLDFEDPTILFYTRAAYLGCQALTFLIYFLVRYKINAKNDLTTLKYVEPANPMSGQTEPRAVVTTVKEYDLQQVNQQIKGIFTGLAMMSFMHEIHQPIVHAKYFIFEKCFGIKHCQNSLIWCSSFW